MSITATQVKDLRDRTGAPMMDCKKALAEANGDMEAALDHLRKKGLATAEKRKGRATKEGLIRIAIEGRVAAIVELNCETDFVSRNEEFQAFASSLAKLAATGGAGSVEALQSQTLNGKPVREGLTDLIGKIGENMQISRLRRLTLEGDGVIEPYQHGERVGVVVLLGGPAGHPKLRETAHELALQIAFSNPLCIERSGVPAETVERERRIARERAQEQGKPANIIDKIVEGQVNKFFGEFVLLEQPYVRDDKMTVKKWLDGEAKTIGGAVALQDFARFELGEMAKDQDEAEG